MPEHRVNDTESIPDKLKRYRGIACNAKGAPMSRSTAAALVGVSPETWKSWEVGRRAPPDDVFQRFSEAYNAHQQAEAIRADKAAAQKVAQAILARSGPAMYKGQPVTRIPDIVEARVHLTPEQEAESADYLAKPFEYTPQSVKDGLAAFNEEQEALRIRSAAKFQAELERSAKILAED